MLGVHPLVQEPEELHRLEILPAAVPVGDPRVLRAPVVEIQHGGHGVHAQRVDVVLLQPEERVADQKVAHLAAAVVEGEGVPVRVQALPGIGVLVEVGAVEERQAVAVAREVGRHPVEDYADPALVEGVHQIHEVVRLAEAAGRGEVAHRLVTPRAVERVLRHRH
jgi:hypothetical protein